MEENLTLITVGATTVHKAVFSSTLFGSMVIFQDPAYIIIALLSTFVSMGSTHYNYETKKIEVESEGKVCQMSLYLELTKAFVISLPLALLSILMFMNGGEHIINHYVKWEMLKGVLPDVWMTLTILLGVVWIPMFSIIQNWLRGKK